MNIDNPYRVYRGGGWGDDPRYARVANRFGNNPSDRNDDLGFRLSRVVNPLRQLSEVSHEQNWLDVRGLP